MKKITFLSIATIFLFGFSLKAQESEEETIQVNDSLMMIAYVQYVDSLRNTLDFKYGEVQLGNDIATLKIPKGYKFVDRDDANVILGDLWNNPTDNSTLGMLLLEDDDLLSTDTYAIEISYEEEGYIEDDDAEDIDYDDLLEEMQKDAKEANPMRIAQGYGTIEIVGWASPPYYDAANKKLHWAKELHFEDYETNTLNYNIRVLGRKGFLTMNVIGDMDVLPNVKENLNPVLASVDFNKGYRYSDFNPDYDEVAAYGIGGLIAGKVLAKAGFFAILLKFWKFIAIGAVGAFGAFKKRLFGNKES